MIRLEQIQLLEKKIDKAVEVIEVLKKENQALRNTLNKSQVRMSELESLLEQFKGEQNKIEAGIMSALSKLDHLEDEVSEVRDSASVNQTAGASVSPPGDNEESSPQDPPAGEPDDAPVEESSGSEPEEEDVSEPEDDDPPEEKEIELDIF